MVGTSLRRAGIARLGVVRDPIVLGQVFIESRRNTDRALGIRELEEILSFAAVVNTYLTYAVCGGSGSAVACSFREDYEFGSEDCLRSFRIHLIPSRLDIVAALAAAGYEMAPVHAIEDIYRALGTGAGFVESQGGDRFALLPSPPSMVNMRGLLDEPIAKPEHLRSGTIRLFGGQQADKRRWLAAWLSVERPWRC